jgi:hypothetical protein
MDRFKINRGKWWTALEWRESCNVARPEGLRKAAKICQRNRTQCQETFQMWHARVISCLRKLISVEEEIQVTEPSKWDPFMNFSIMVWKGRSVFEILRYTCYFFFQSNGILFCWSGIEFFVVIFLVLGWGGGTAMIVALSIFYRTVTTLCTTSKFNGR